MLKKALIFACFILLAPSFAIAQSKSDNVRICTEAQAKQAKKEAGNLKNWFSVYRSFKRFAHCDENDMEISEQYSVSISRLLAYDWKNVGAFLRLASSDKKFEQFVIEHINESIGNEEAYLIIDNARLRCPRGGEKLCDAIATR